MRLFVVLGTVGALVCACGGSDDPAVQAPVEAPPVEIDEPAAPVDDPVAEPELAPLAEVAVAYQAESLTDIAKKALGAVPRWVRGDLTLSWLMVSSETQDELASILLTTADKRLVDEIAFVMAHMSPEVLEDTNFYPWMLHENAELMYARDADLKYVELVDVGTPGVDDDWYTTAKYRIEVDGEVVEKTIDRDMYYWYVVHPRIEDDRPYYIDPAQYCPDLNDQCPSSPMGPGRFWREFLWDGHQEYCTGAPDATACPMMADYLADTDVLWKTRKNTPEDNGAVGQIIQWIQARQYFGAKGERSIQPVRIAVLGRGNCGEWADMTTAVARTALIPNHNVGAHANDHTWNEFWDDGWRQWEPVGNKVIDYNYYRNDELEAGGNPCYAVTATRGDGLVWDRSEQYANTFQLTVTVQDVDGRPVDGARVAVYGPNTTYEDMAGTWWYATEGVTDVDGKARITLGEKRTIAIRVSSELGNFPVEDNKVNTVVQESVAGQDEAYTVTLEGAMPAPLAVTKKAVEPGEDLLRVEVAQTVTGYRLLGQSRYGTTFSLEHDRGKLDRFVLDGENYAKFQAGEPFEAADLVMAADSDEQVLELPAEGAWTLVLSNNDPRATAAVGDLVVNALSVDFALLPGDYVAIDLTP